MDETDHGLTPQIGDLKVNRKVNEINDLPTPPPRQCWVYVPPVIALKTRGPQERGVFVDHVTVHRWSIKVLPVLAAVFRKRKRPVGAPTA